jgi:hypothetical protein
MSILFHSNLIRWVSLPTVKKQFWFGLCNATIFFLYLFVVLRRSVNMGAIMFDDQGSKSFLLVFV